jgi:UDP-N-acetylmuramyl pentapeptide phosphotransferase/UDP-N-acetylglucosamine-1-phosphate transferase
MLRHKHKYAHPPVQSILKYVDMHASKSGTPTMGGLIFILPIILIAGIVLIIVSRRVAKKEK